MTTHQPTPAVAGAVRSAVGKHAVSWEPVIGGGYTRQAKWRVRFADGSTAFVKAAQEEPYSSALRREVAVYESVDGSFLPRLLATRQEGDYAALLSGHFAVEAPAPLPEWAEGSS
jgi:hypothetical protein